MADPQVVTVDSYRVQPASNGWVVSWDAKQTAYPHQVSGYMVVCRTSKEVAAFFRSLDASRDRAKILSAKKKPKQVEDDDDDK
jgi:hypothetical protein